MQTRRKPLSRNGATEPRCRPQKKALEHAQIVEEKVVDLITSVRKQRFVQVGPGTTPKKGRDVKLLKKLSTSHILVETEAHNVGLTRDAIGVSMDSQSCETRIEECKLDTLFSPGYHISNDPVKEISSTVNCTDVFRTEDRYPFGAVEAKGDECTDLRWVDSKNQGAGIMTDVSSTSHDDMNVDSGLLSTKEPHLLNCNEDKVGDNLSSEVSAIYLAMQQSKLECIDEPNEDSLSEICVEADECDEVDDFDPYLFIKNLPELSEVVPTYRPLLLPKQTRSCPRTTLVLDLDETLVHSSLEHCEDADFTFPVNFNLMEHTVYVRCRPHLKDFLEGVANVFEIIVFTASQSIYAEQLLNVLDPKRRLFRHRVYRESCVFVDGNYLKDLSVLGRDLSRVIIVDNSPQAFGFQVDNGIPIQSWFHDPTDRALPDLLPFLETLVGVDDVRPILARKFNLREKVASAVGSSLKFH